VAEYSRKELSVLRERWRGSLYVNAMQGLIAERATSPFGETHDGLLDFRGVEVNQVVSGRSFDRVDFSGSTQAFVGQFMRCRFNACVFDCIALDTNLGSAFADCSLVAANLSGAKLFGGFVRCSFASANLSSAAGTGVRFEDCVFDRANFKRAHFLEGSFTRCSATGAKFGGCSLGGCRIEGGNVREQDLTNTILEGVSFSG